VDGKEETRNLSRRADVETNATRIARYAGMLALAAALALAIAGPASAAGKVYCVHQGPFTCTGTDVGDNLQLALNAAAGQPGLDTVIIGPGSYTGPFTYTANSTDPVQVIGSGEDATTLTAPTADNEVVLLLGDASGQTHNYVSHLHVLMPAAGDGEGLVLGGNASHVRVTEAMGGAALEGVDLQGASSFDQGQVSVDLDALAIGAGPGSHISASTLTGGQGVRAIGGGTVEVSRVSVVASFAGILTSDSHVVVEDALVRLTSTEQAASGVLPWLDGSASVYGSTIVGVGGGTGAQVQGIPSGLDPYLQLYDTIIWGFGTDLACIGGNGASLQFGYSRFATLNLQGCSAWQNWGGNTSASPDFVDPTVTFFSPGTDFRLRWSSPLIDVGGPQYPLSMLTDLDGLPRVRDGNGDGGAKIDLGAYEYQRRSPTAVAGASPPQVATAAPVAFSAAGSSDPDSGDTLTYNWTFDDGATGTGSQVSHAFASAGIHTATLTVTDPTGLSASASASVAVSQPPPPPPPADLTSPTVTGLRVTPARFRVGKNATKVVVLSVPGTTIRFNISEAARVRLAFQRVLPGRLSHGVCRRPTKRLRRARRCTRYLGEGALIRQALAGANRVRFSGRIGRRAIKVGRHRLGLTARDTAGNASKTYRAPFRILAPKTRHRTRARR
jgi:PKD domain